jgi:hypothetical protein
VPNTRVTSLKQSLASGGPDSAKLILAGGLASNPLAASLRQSPVAASPPSPPLRRCRPPSPPCQRCGRRSRRRRRSRPLSVVLLFNGQASVPPPRPPWPRPLSSPQRTNSRRGVEPYPATTGLPFCRPMRGLRVPAGCSRQNITSAHSRHTVHCTARHCICVWSIVGHWVGGHPGS